MCVVSLVFGTVCVWYRITYGNSKGWQTSTSNATITAMSCTESTRTRHCSRYLVNLMDSRNKVDGPVAAPCQACLCGRSLAGIGSSNPAGNMFFFFWSFVNVVFCQVEFYTTGRCLVQSSPTECVCVCVTECDQVRQ